MKVISNLITLVGPSFILLLPCIVPLVTVGRCALALGHIVILLAASMPPRRIPHGFSN
jgi:hypothetical protein